MYWKWIRNIGEELPVDVEPPKDFETLLIATLDSSSGLISADTSFEGGSVLK
jgi:hypothetical protein